MSRDSASQSSTVMRAVRALGHDLHRGAVQPRDAHAHQPVAETGDHRLDDMGDAGLEARLGHDARLARVW